MGGDRRARLEEGQGWSVSADRSQALDVSRCAMGPTSGKKSEPVSKHELCVQ